jgi:hypothetical protein
MSTLAAGSLRDEPSTVAVKGIEDPAELSPDLLILLNDRGDSTIERAPVKTWGDSDIPNFGDFHTIILEAPNDVTTYQSYRQDLRLADLAGATIVWIACANSSSEVLAQITGTEALRFRAAVNGACCTVVDRRFESLFAAAPAVWLAFSGGGTFSPIAYRDSAEVVTALIHERRAGKTVILPPPRDYPGGYTLYAEKLRTLSRKNSPAARGLRNFFTALAMPVVVAAGIVALASHQQTYNARYLARPAEESLHKFGVHASNNLLDFLSYYPRERITTLIGLPPGATLDASDDGEVLAFYERLGLYSQSAAYFSRIVATRPRDAKFYDSIERYASVAYEQMIPALQNHLFEIARFEAQKYLNAAKLLPGPQVSNESQERLDTARKVVKLVERNYLYPDSRALDMIVGQSIRANDFQFDMTVRRDETRNPELFDNFDYAKYAAGHGATTSAQVIADWQQFQHDYPSSELIEDAAFNELSAKMDSYADVKDLAALNRECLVLADDFVRRFPASSLADDALYYELKMASTLGDERVMWLALARLADLPASDCARHVDGLFRTFWGPGREGRISVEGEALRDYALGAARHIAAGEPPAPMDAHLRTFCGNLLGENAADLNALPSEKLCAKLIIHSFRNYHEH